MELASFVAGVAALFAIPAWAAWSTWHTHFAVATAIQVTAVWVALCLWLALR